MVAFPAVWALIYVSASFWSVSRLHAAEAFVVNIAPAKTIEQNMMVTFIFSLFICACLPGLFASIVWANRILWCSYCGHRFQSRGAYGGLCLRSPELCP